MTYYLYESHLGGVYWTTEQQSFEDLYCEECGDSNWLMGTFETMEELKELLYDYEEEYQEMLLKEFIGEFI